jgi:hypothetical protein
LNRTPSRTRVGLRCHLQSEVAVDYERLLLVAPHGARDLAARLVAANTSVGIELRSLAAPLVDDAAPATGVGRVLGLERAFDGLLGSPARDSGPQGAASTLPGK